MTELNRNVVKKPTWIIIASITAVLFGIMTIKSGGTALFTEAGQKGAGNYVPFVLWFNFIAGFAYVLAGVALFRLKSCSRRLATVIAGSTVIVFIIFGIHIFAGGTYELRTVAAMTIRSTLWIIIAISALRSKFLKPATCKC